MATHYELYRKSTVGVTLEETLDEFSDLIPKTLVDKIRLQFDKSISEALANKVTKKNTFKGHLHTYRFCDNVWTFILDNPTFRAENSDIVQVEKVKIVACDGKAQN